MVLFLRLKGRRSMRRTEDSRSARAGSALRVLLAIVVSGLLVAAVSGCSGASGQKTMASSVPANQSKSMMMAPTANTDPSVPSCYQCSGKGKPPVTKGVGTVDGGTQTVNIKIESGYYAPNIITVKAAVPTKVVFTGKTKDCVGKPKFGSLNKQIDIRKTGAGTIDLGSLSPGTYKFTCGMGANEGSIIAE
jgi:hypothetical protein